MARGGERDTLIRLQRNVVCLVVCLTFGVVFSKPGIQLMNDAYHLITSSFGSWANMTGVRFKLVIMSYMFVVLYKLSKALSRGYEMNALIFNKGFDGRW